jgi:hypothetical protein
MNERTRMRHCTSENLEIPGSRYCAPRNDWVYFPPKCQSLVSMTRSMKARTLADSNREVG